MGMTAAQSADSDRVDTLADTHAYAREHGASPRLYAALKAVAGVLVRLWFRFRVSGADRIPADGPVVITPNHKDFSDPILIGLASPRPVRFMAKAELFHGPLGWLILRLGAFPVRRGASDQDALETARTILSHGEVLAVFPEGRLITDAARLGSPHRGGARLAVEAGAPIVPAAIAGSSGLSRGTLPRTKDVQVSFLPAVPPRARADGTQSVVELIDERVWPAVSEEYGRLRANAGAVAASLGLIAVGGGLLVWRRRGARRTPAPGRRLARVRRRVKLPTRGSSAR
jgi:1-acyl-sn-glycerol-3-phosphate acyltransferase